MAAAAVGPWGAPSARRRRGVGTARRVGSGQATILSMAVVPSSARTCLVGYQYLPVLRRGHPHPLLADTAKQRAPLAAGVRVSSWPPPALLRCVPRRGALAPPLHLPPPRRVHPRFPPDPPVRTCLPVVMAQQLGPVASVLLKLPGMTALARRAAASYQAAVGNELRKYGTLMALQTRRS